MDASQPFSIITIPAISAGREYHVQDEHDGGNVVGSVGGGVVSQLQSGVVDVVVVVVGGQSGG